MKVRIPALIALALAAEMPVWADDVVDRVRASLAVVVDSLPPGRPGTADYIREFGVIRSRLSGYANLVDVVTNNQDFVCTNFNVCATNEISQLMLLSAWWGGDDSMYLNGLSRCLDLTVSGTLSRNDLMWYRFGHRNDRRGCILALRYNEPGVSNLVIRLCNYTGETNYCSRVLSGEARERDARYLDEISHLKEQ